MKKYFIAGTGIPVQTVFLLILFSLFFISRTIGQTPKVTLLQPRFSESTHAHIPFTGEGDNQKTTGTACPNSNFSLGNFNNWVGHWGTFYNPSANLGFVLGPNPPARHLIIPAPGTIDPYGATGGGAVTLNTVFPGEAFSARLGNDQTGAQAEQLSYDITIGPETDFFIYRYAVVLNDNNHIPEEQPSFEINIFDKITGLPYDSICGYYYVYAQPGLQGWYLSQLLGGNNPGAPVYWTDWTTVGLAFDLSDYGKELTIVFTTKDCEPTGHFGYAYISAYCTALSVTFQGCEGSNQVIMTGPPGFADYEWTGPYCAVGCTPGIVGTTPTITINNAVTGDQYRLKLVSFYNYPNCVIQKVVSTVAFTQIDAGFTSAINCIGNPSTFTDTSIINQNATDDRKWDFGDGSLPVTVTTPVTTHTYALAGTYPVTLIRFTTDPCSDTVTTNIVVAEVPPTITNLPPVKSICSGDSTYVLMTFSQPGADATWTSTVTTGTATITNNPASQSGNLINDLIVNTGAVNAVVTYSITPRIGDCIGVPDTLLVTVYPLPVPGIVEQAGIPFCGNSTLTYTTEPGQNNYTWQALPDGIIAEIPPYGNVITVTWPTAGAKTVTANYVDAVTSCTATTPTSYALTINPLPVPAIVQQSGVPLCLNSTITYTTEPGKNNYAWQALPDGIIAELPPYGNMITVTWPSVGAKTVTANYVEPLTLCTAAMPTPFLLTINPLPVPGIVQQSGIPPCKNATLTYTTEPGQNNYNWQALPDGIITEIPPYGNVITVTWPTTGNKTVKVNYIDPVTLCTANLPSSFLLNVKSLPVPGIVQQAGITLCQNSTLTYTTEPGKNNYDWQALPDGIIAEIPPYGNVITVTWPSAGAKTVTLNYTDPLTLCTAASPTSFALNINPLPVPGIVQQSGVPLCLNSTLTYSSEAGQNSYDWQALPDGIISETPPYGNVITVTWPTIGPKTVTANYIDPVTLCTAAAPTVFALTINPLPVPGIIQQAGVPPCKNSTLTYTTEPGQNNYIWEALPDGIISEIPPYGNVITVTWPTTGNKTVKVNYTDPVTLCTAALPSSFLLNVKPLPVPGIVQQAGIPLCQNSTLTYTTEAGKNSYTWSVLPDGIIAEIPPFGNVITVTWPSAGAKTVTVNYVDPITLCTAAAPTSFALNINPLPVPIIVQQSGIPFCQNATLTYSTEPGKNNYDWQALPDGIIAELPPYGNLITVTWPTAGAKTVMVNYVDNITGCTATLPTGFNLVINPLPVPTFTAGENSVCLNIPDKIYSTEPGQTNYLWTIPPQATITAGGTVNDNSVTLTWTSVGNYSISVNYTEPATLCTAPVATQFDVTVKPLPDPTFTAGENSVCLNIPGQIYTTQSGMTGYIWTIPAEATITAGGTVNDNSITLTWITAGNYSISVNYTEPSTQCTAPGATQFAVTVKPLPVPTIIAGENSVCLNIPGKIYTTEPGRTNYLWTIPPEATITAGGTVNDNSVTLTWTSVGTYFISVNYTDPATQCTAPIATQFDVTVKPLPVPSFTSGENSVCLNIPDKIYTTEPGQTNYLWTIPPQATVTAGGTVNDNSVTLTWTSVGNYSISVNYIEPTTLCTAPVATQFDVTVKPLPDPTFTAGENSVCLNIPGKVYSTQAGMTGYIWTVPPEATITAGGTVNDNSITLTWTTAGNYSISVNYTEPTTQCTAPAPTQFAVTVKPLPDPTFTAGENSVCLNIPGKIYTTEAGKTNYLWTVPPEATITAGGTVNDNSVTLTWTSVGNYSISVNYTDPVTQCTAPIATQFDVTVKPLPSPTFTAGENSVCLNIPDKIYTTEPGQTNYLWTIPPQATVTAGGTVNDNSVTLTWTSVGNYSISVNYTEPATLCTSPVATQFDVTVKPLPDPTFTNGENSVCLNIPGKVYSTQAGMTGYIWTVPPEATITAGGTVNDNSITLTWTTAGNYSISVNYTEPTTQCTAPVPTQFAVTVEPLPVPTIITGENSVCLNIPGKIYTTEAGKTNYLWTIPPEATITAGGTVNDNSVTLTWTSAGSYSISVNYTEPATQCTAPAATQYPVIVHSLPVPVIAGPNSVCKNTTVQYTTESGMMGYQWTVDAAYGTMTPVPGIPHAIDVTWNVTGSTQVTVNYVDANNCTAPTPSIYPVTIQLLPTPTIIPPGHQEVCKGDVFIYNTQQNANTYTWDIQPLSGRTILSGGTSTSSFIEVRWDDPGSYVIALNYSIGIGCTAAAPTLHPVTVNELPDPVITTFPGGPICGYTSYTYTTTGAPGHTYLWSVTGGTITNGGGANNAYVTILWGNTPPVSIDLIETAHYTGVDCSVQAATFLPTFKPWPDPAGEISGPASVCLLWTGQVYTVPAIPYAFDYEWIYTGTGVTLIPGGNSVTINFSGVATSGLLTVKGHNDCGYGPVSPAYSITVNPLPVVAYSLCNDAFTTKYSKPFILKGGNPFGPTGTYHLNNPNAAALPGNVFNPGDPAVFIGSNTIYYTYTTVNSCKASASQTITVLSPNIGFQCGVNMLTDPRDNNTAYRTIQIGSNCWMGENLRYGAKVTFPSPNQPQPQTDNCINEKYCLPTDNVNCTTYGGLYQWDELIQYGQTQAPYQGVCPPEWHIPTFAEWQDLINTLALMSPGDGIAGNYLPYPTGFKAFRYGIYYLNNSWAYTTGNPAATMFWTSTFSNGKPIARGLNTISPSVSLYESSRANAFPVRCVKD